MNIPDGAEVNINCKHLKHAQQRVKFFPIISVWELQMIKLDYLENGLLNFRENFADTATCHCLPLRASAEFLNNLKRF